MRYPKPRAGSFLKNGPPKNQTTQKMPNYLYRGKKSENLAGVGQVNPGDIITVSTEVGDALEKNAPDMYELTADKARVAPPVPVTAGEKPPEKGNGNPEAGNKGGAKKTPSENKNSETGNQKPDTENDKSPDKEPKKEDPKAPNPPSKPAPAPAPQTK